VRGDRGACFDDVEGLEGKFGGRNGSGGCRAERAELGPEVTDMALRFKIGSADETSVTRCAESPGRCGAVGRAGTGTGGWPVPLGPGRFRAPAWSMSGCFGSARHERFCLLLLDAIASTAIGTQARYPPEHFGMVIVPKSTDARPGMDLYLFNSLLRYNRS
jgi:hypothetical protein